MPPIDYSRYPPNWKTAIVPAVMKRAGNACEKCSLKNGQTVFAVSFRIRDIDNQYKLRSVWFSNRDDAMREAKEDTEVRKIKVVITIAHLNHDEENADVKLTDLMAMCQACHLRYDAKEKYRRALEKW